MQDADNGCNDENQKGISLFVVISALLILSVLTISITAQLMAPTFAATTATQQITRENNFRSAVHMLRPIIRMASITGTPQQENLPKLDGTAYELMIGGQPQSFILQDVNGLIDINSASQSLLLSFLSGLGQAAQLEAILSSRANAPFKSVETVATRLATGDFPNIQSFLTVNSGKRRINSQTAPLGLLQILAQQNGSRAQLISQIDRRLFRIRPVTVVLVLRN